tara:strand:+ start:29682 stop:30599 length:918 start_codon:yes stop_codon:yes gene_type:complete
MSKKLTTKTFILKANIVHKNMYNYSLSNYTKSTEKIEIICNLHGSFNQISNDHLTGAGCPACSGKKRITTKSFIKRANIVHNNLYNYSLVNFTKSQDKVKIICNTHGVFEQIAYNHLSGAICAKCSKNTVMLKRRTPIDVFIKKANIIHNHKYDYSKVKYINNYTKILIICKNHGDFYQIPNSHLSKQGCAKCKNSNISKIEMQWLDYLNIPNEYRQVPIIINNKKYRTDAYDPITNTIYEFYGDFWHGNPNKYKPDYINKCNKFSFGTLYKRTMLKEQIYKEANYNVISIWEQDFKKLIKKVIN